MDDTSSSHTRPGAFPLSPAAHLHTVLDAFHWAFVPWLEETLRSHGIEPQDALPDSSPVRKHGFRLDVRGGLTLARHHRAMLVADGARNTLRDAARDLATLRDWLAHAQPLERAMAIEAARLAETILLSTGRFQGAACLSLLAGPPEGSLAELADFLASAPLPVSLRDTLEALRLADTDADRLALTSRSLWLGARQKLLGEPLSVLGIVRTRGTGLPDARLWWLAGLPDTADNASPKRFAAARAMSGNSD